MDDLILCFRQYRRKKLLFLNLFLTSVAFVIDIDIEILLLLLFISKL